MKYFRLFIVLAFITVFSSCSKKNDEVQYSLDENQTQFIQVTAKNHSWYFFNNSGFQKTDKPQNVPSVPFVPWTESRRISAANTCTETGQSIPPAFAVVNRTGILCFEDDKVTLSRDSNIFDDRTASNLIFIDNTPVFSVYKSSFFNKTSGLAEYINSEDQHLFLIQFDVKSRLAYPLLTCSNLIPQLNSEVTDFSWDGTEWICSVKSIEKDRIFFSYIKWNSTAPVLSLSPTNASEHIITSEADADIFRATKEPKDFSQAPDRIKKLVSSTASKISFDMDIKVAGGFSTRSYHNKASDSARQNVNGTKDFLAKALLSKSWSAALFQDGTFYIEGALPGRHILRGGKPIALRLPRLPENFIYTDFTISGTTLYAAWEETDFYKTGRAGFISIDLDKTLYKN